MTCQFEKNGKGKVGYLDEKVYLGETGIRDEVFNGNEVHHCEINKSANE